MATPKLAKHRRPRWRDWHRQVEWPTLVMLCLCYGGWVWGTTGLTGISLLAMVCVTLSTALHSSLSHEALHGHPTSSPVFNALLVFPALSVTVPYLRFKDTHMAHHRDSILTDPYDDPESNFWDPAVWGQLAPWQQRVLQANNTLAGRLLIGPALGSIAFVLQDMRAIATGDRRVLLGWLLHIPALALVLWWMSAVALMPLWAWGICVYAALAILKIRTFLEHRAHDIASGRTVIIEDKGILSWLFLNNNLHLVHHMHAKMPWYRLPQMYYANKERYLSRNKGYLYSSYGDIFRRYLLRPKDPVPHPLWPFGASKR